jgi:hypothetical protein
MDKWLDGQELARFEKNASEDMRLTLHKWTIGQYVDIRVWTKIRPSDDSPSNPTERGFVLDVDLLPDLRRALDKAIVALGGAGSPDREFVIRVVHTKDGGPS